MAHTTRRIARRISSYRDRYNIVKLKGKIKSKNYFALIFHFFISQQSKKSSKLPIGTGTVPDNLREIANQGPAPPSYYSVKKCDYFYFKTSFEKLRILNKNKNLL